MAMINVKLSTSTSRTNVIVDSSKTVKQILEENDINYGTCQIHLDGAPLSAYEMNDTLEDIGVTDSCYLVAVVNTKNA